MKNHSNCCRPHRHRFHGLGFASLLIIGGALLLCVKLNIIPAKYSDAFISWQMLLIVAGISSLFKRHIFGAITFLSIGIFFIIPEIGKVPDNFIGQIPANFKEMYWPTLLIIAGIMFLFRKCSPWGRRHNFHEKMREHWERHHFHEHMQGDWEKRDSKCCNTNQILDGYVESNCVFNSGEQIVLDPEFKGGEINTVFGETKIDLRKTNLVEGKTKLEINIVFGSVIIFVPEDWVVQISVDTIFGGFEDKRFNKTKNADTNKILVIHGSIIFGSGELRN
jgi:hypothetical protein